MHLRSLAALTGSLVLLGLAGGRAHGQNTAPFSIRYPPDGATVREKVPVRVPIASIPEGGYVSFAIDGQFRVALSPTAAQRARAKPGQMFEFQWNTKSPVRVRGSVKEEAPKDGEHVVTARLYGPAKGAAGGSKLLETSAVHVTLANKITTDPGAIRLRYQWRDASNRTYSRSGEVSVVGGLTQGAQATGDVELIGQNSDLLLAVEDLYSNGRAIVRNRLTRLAVRRAGQETIYPEQYLPKSLYQEIDPRGIVHYQNSTVSFDQFAMLGLPVSATLDMPILPTHAVRVGDTWTTPNVVIDIPGTPPDKQPRVSVKSTLEGLEWQDGYPTAKVHQEYSGTPKEKTIVFGTTEIESPRLKFTRDIYLAYRSGTLVKIDRTLEVTGKTVQAVNPYVGGAMGPGAPPMLGSGGMGRTTAPGMPPTGPAAMGMLSPGLSRGSRGGVTAPGMVGPPGVGNPYGGYGPTTGSRGAGRRNTGRGRPTGGSLMMPGSGAMGPGAMMGSSSGMVPGMGGGMNPYRPSGQAQASSQITLKSTLVTELKRTPPSRTASSR